MTTNPASDINPAAPSGILFIDTETTGKAYFDLPPNDARQPRMVQIAAMLTDQAGKRLAEFCTLITPDAWQIPQQATAVHGITTDQCREFGILLRNALTVVSDMMDVAGTIVAHNLDFDAIVLEGEFLRKLERTPFRPTLHGACTMKLTTDIVRIPSPYRAGAFKWPATPF